jgi:hypothetical protein
VTSAAGCVVGGFIYLSSASTGYRAIFQIVHIAGTTITTDRAVTQPFVSTDTALAYNSSQVPQDIVIEAAGAKVEGLSVVSISLQTCYRARVSGLIFDAASATSPSDAFGIFNNATYDGYIADCYANGYTGGAPSVGIGFEGCDSCVAERIHAHGCAAYGMAFIESWNCAFRDCISTGNSYGFVWSNDSGPTTAGSDNCLVENCRAIGNTNDGFFVDWGTNGAKMIGCLAMGNGGFGFNIDGTGAGSGGSLSNCTSLYNAGPWKVASGALHTQMSNMYVDGNGGAIAHAADVTISGLRGTLPTGDTPGISITAGNTIITNADLKHTGGAAAGLFSMGGGTLKLIASRLSLNVNGDIGVWMVSGASSVWLNSVIITATGGASATYAAYNQSGALAVRDSDGSGCANGFTAAGGTVGTDTLTSTAETVTVPLVVAASIQSDTSQAALAVGTNNSGASLILQGGALVTGISITAPGSTAGTAITSITGALRLTTHTVATTYTVDTTTYDYTIFVDTSGGAFTITLPAPTNGRVLWLIDKANTFSSNNLTLARHGSEKIDFYAGSKVISANGFRGFVTSDGTDWYVH